MAKEMSKTEKMRALHGDKELNVEQLEQVAGGTTDQAADDSRFLNVLLRGRPGQCDRYGEYKLSDATYHACRRLNEIREAWASVGVDAYPFNGGSRENVYVINGQGVTREQAWAHAQKVVGKTLKKSDWYWD